jgi:hypothetical protein
MPHVPYKTTGPALMDVIAGRVSMMFADFTTSVPHVKAGRVDLNRSELSCLLISQNFLPKGGTNGHSRDALRSKRFFRTSGTTALRDRCGISRSV